jgi:hypothetical protein
MLRAARAGVRQRAFTHSPSVPTDSRAGEGDEHWTAKQLITGPNGDTVTSVVVGGVISDTPSGAKIKTTETITGGTGRFAGAHGKTTTTGETTLQPNGNQVFTFRFSGSLTTTS